MNTVTHQNCPLCGSANIAHYLTTKDHMLTGEVFDIWKCNDCSFIFTQGIPPSGEIGHYYQGPEYISHSDTRKGLMNKLYHMGRSFMQGEKYRMVSKVANGKNLLDIGCGTGYFPAYMKRKGYKVAGVEVDPGAREFARKEFGLAVYTPEEFLNYKIEGKFDVITLWHVLEHLDDFNLYFERMLAQLTPSGSMVIALPNCSAHDARHYKEFWAGYDVPRHLWHFTPSTFSLLADKHGLKVTKMKRLPLDPYYNSMLSEKYKGNKLFMISGTIIGKLALIESLFDLKKSSSIVYFVNHKENPR
jgi:2-polyprenyl-3-methyl-5-hydroxy-6-metoxy-1,4-benzoquinol methylase